MATDLRLDKSYGLTGITERQGGYPPTNTSSKYDASMLHIEDETDGM